VFRFEYSEVMTTKLQYPSYKIPSEYQNNSKSSYLNSYWFLVETLHY